MPQFGQQSLNKLGTCHPDLQRLFLEVVKHWDCTVVCGHRGEAEQNEAFRAKKSTKQWPNSKHNILPSIAVDVAPYYPGEGIPWNDIERFRMFTGFVLGVASQLQIKIIAGGDWDGDRVLTDQRLIDLPHYELAT